MAKKKLENQIQDEIINESYNPLWAALKANDKKNLFSNNITTYFHKTGFPLYDYYLGSVINVHDEKGNIIRQDPMVGQCAGVFNMICGKSGSGKALPDSTMIPTPYGYKLMGSLEIGDFVLDNKGNPTRVIAVYPQGHLDIYEITFSDGRKCKCSLDHLWTVYENKDEDLIDPNNLEKKVLSLDQIMKHENYKNHLLFKKLTNYVYYEKQKTEDDPYLYALKLISGKINVNKIDERYLFNDYNTRSKFLKGLCDLNAEIKEVKYTNVDKRYIVVLNLKNSLNEYYYEKPIKQILSLIHGLGYSAHLLDGNIIFNIKYSQFKELFSRFSYKYHYAIQIEKTCEDKKEIKLDYLSIDNITKLEYKDSCTCIRVDNRDHQFLTDEFIPTHNTTFTIQIAANIIRPYKHSSIEHYDCENRLQQTRVEVLTGLPVTDFDEYGRYHIHSGAQSLEDMQEVIVRLYVEKMKLKDQLMVSTGRFNELGKEIKVFEPTVIIMDSIANIISETFSYTVANEVNKAAELRSNTDGARDAKTIRGFLKEVLPLCKEANIIIFAINHITSNMNMNAFIPASKQQNNLNQDEAIPGGNALVFNSFNILKMIAKPSDDFVEDVDGFNGHLVLCEPIKSSSNQSGNARKGVSFEMVFSFKTGFDPLRSLIWYGKEHGIIEGNKPRMKFKEDDSFTFAWKNIYQESREKPIWENIKKYIIPELEKQLPYAEPNFDERSLDY